eukprot:g2126.t1
MGGGRECTAAAFSAGACVVPAVHPSIFLLAGADAGFSHLHLAICLCAIICFTMAVEALMERLEEETLRRAHVYFVIGAKVVKELTILGLVSFGIFIGNQGFRLNETEYFLPLEFAHIVIFFTAVFFVFDALCNVHAINYISKRYDVDLAASRDDMRGRLRALHHSLRGEGRAGALARSLRDWLRALRWYRSETREIAMMQIMRHVFIDKHGLPENFDFGRYLHLSLNENVAEMLDVRPAAWLVLVALVWLLYLLARVTSGPADVILGFVVMGWAQLAVCLVLLRMSRATCARAVLMCMPPATGHRAACRGLSPHAMVEYAVSVTPESKGEEELDEAQRRIREFLATHQLHSGDITAATRQAARVQSTRQALTRLNGFRRWNLNSAYAIPPVVVRQVLNFCFLVSCLYKSVFVCYFVTADFASASAHYGGTRAAWLTVSALPILINTAVIWPSVSYAIHFMDAITEMKEDVFARTAEEMEEGRQLKAYLLHKLHAHTSASRDWLRDCFQEWARLKDDDGMIDRREMKQALALLDVTLSKRRFAQLMRQLDPYRNGKIVYEEFATFVCSLTPEEYLATDLDMLALHREQLATVERRLQKSLRLPLAPAPAAGGCVGGERGHGSGKQFPGFVEIQRFDECGKGRGLVAMRAVKRGTFLLRAPCLRVPMQEYQEHAKHTILEHYVFSTRSGDMLVALGWGSLFNHNANPNVDYHVQQDRNGAAQSHDDTSIDFFAARDLVAGEELCIYYGHKPEWDGEDDDDEDDNPLGFGLGSSSSSESEVAADSAPIAQQEVESALQLQ